MRHTIKDRGCAAEGGKVGFGAFLRGDHGATLPILRKNALDGAEDQPRAQRDQSQVAFELKRGPRRRRRRDAPRSCLHPMYPNGEADQAGGAGHQVGTRGEAALAPFRLRHVVLADDLLHSPNGPQAGQDLLQVLQIRRFQRD